MRTAIDNLGGRSIPRELLQLHELPQGNWKRLQHGRVRDPETLKERRYDVAKNMKFFEEINALYRAD